MAKNNNENPSYPFEDVSPRDLDFDMLYRHYFDFILRDVFKMFIFENLPETVNETFLKYCIFIKGKVVFFKLDSGELVALNGVYSDTQDLYYLPENMVVSNPLTKTYHLKRNQDCIVVYCSETDIYNLTNRLGGMYSLIVKTATMLADNDLSINVAQKNTRLINVLSAEDQNTKESIEMVIKKQYAGDPVAVVMKTLIDNVQSVPLVSTTSNQYLVQLVELHQYILAHFYEAIGLSTHDNMKKERLITDEINDNDNLCKLNINNMLETIQNGLNKVNEKYGQNITIKLNPLLEPESDQDPDEQQSEQASDERQSEQDSDDQQSDQQSDEPQSDQQPDPDEKDSDLPSDEQQSDQQKEQNIEITINLQDEAIADIVIDNGGENVSDEPGIQMLGNDSGNDNESI